MALLEGGLNGIGVVLLEYVIGVDSEVSKAQVSSSCCLQNKTDNYSHRVGHLRVSEAGKRECRAIIQWVPRIHKEE